MDDASRNGFTARGRMMRRRIFVLVPSLDLTGPVKGAVALCNGLAPLCSVTFVSLKNEAATVPELHPTVLHCNLAHYGSFAQRLDAYRCLLREAGGRDELSSISFCLSADILNSFCRAYATIVSSVRGNLPRNYRYDFGRIGVLYAYGHLLWLHRFDRVIVMSCEMRTQLRRFGLRRLDVIHNFVDESNLERHRIVRSKRARSTRFVFVSSLSPRKRPDLLVQVMKEVSALGVECSLDIVGDGPMRSDLEQQVNESGLQSQIVFHGYLDNPYAVIQKADWFVHPSVSEGMARSVLEALYFGVPCILRDVDANASLITTPETGLLFSDDEELVDRILEATRIQMDEPPANGHAMNLLAKEFRQKWNIQRFLECVV